MAHMKKDLALNVTANIGFDRETIERCLRLVEWYWNDNPHLKLTIKEVESDNQFKRELKFEMPLYEEIKANEIQQQNESMTNKEFAERMIAIFTENDIEEARKKADVLIREYLK